MRKIIINCFLVLLALVLVAAAFVGFNIYQNQTFEETFYTLYADTIQDHVRLVVISDLHQLQFGPENAELISRVEALEPHAIIIAGDVIEKTDPDVDMVLRLCEHLQAIAPVYYGFGNHENHVVYGNDLTKRFLDAKREITPKTLVDFTPLEQNSRLTEGLKALGVTVLQNSAVTAELNGSMIDIGGVSTGLDGFWDYSGQFVYSFTQQTPDHYKLLICHRPEVVMQYLKDESIDLALCGHLHGGCIRIPGKGGLYASDQGLFPDYDAGLYERGMLNMIVSRGFAGIRWIPRILNKPELVVVDLY